jgi:Cytochrome P460
MDKRIGSVIAAFIGAALAACGGIALAAQDRFAVKVPGGLALAECRGYETWQTVGVAQSEDRLDLIVANPAAIAAFKSGVPANGTKFPDGSRIAKILWSPKQDTDAPFPVRVPDTLMGIGCMVKDNKRFADMNGWGFAQFDYDAANGTFAPNTALQGNDARCGYACHYGAFTRDFVYTAYPKR